MKKISFLFSVLLLILGTEAAIGGELYLNLFRNPSIGPEYRIKYFSTHIGYYPTIISKNDNGENESTGFIRTGITAWPTSWAYVSVSHLRGLDGKWKGKDEMLYETGIQGLYFNDRIVFRLGIAVLPSKEFGTKVNPTPGVSVRIPF